MKHTSQMIDALYTHGLCYLGMLNDTNNHVNKGYPKLLDVYI